MKKLLSLGLLLISSISFSQTLVVSKEAETGTYSGVTVSTSVQGYSGSGYLTNFDKKQDYCIVTFSVPSAGIYDLKIGYRSEYGDKLQDVYINNVLATQAKFPYTKSFKSFFVGQIELKSGTNTLKVQSNWGFVDLDYVSIYTSTPHDYSKTAVNLIDEKASNEAKTVYSFLRQNYGQTILSGQNFYWDELIAVVSKTPVIQSFDFQNYSPQNPWGSNNGAYSFKPWDDGTVNDIAKWYKNSDGCGLVTIQWHWFSPSGGTLRKSTFYTDETTFDVSKAVQVGTTEYNEVIRDIDAVAYQLQRLEAAKIPVLWRPLHEAGGSWFWWGAKGPDAAKKLWDIMYDRITNHHNIHNLIWVWGTPEEDYYPGNDKVDVFGYDSYPGAYNYDVQKSHFDQMYETCKGEKILALTENGPIPSIDDCFSKDAKWAYFCSWSDLVTEQNSLDHLKEVYAHSKVSTLDEKCALTSVNELTKVSVSLYPNPVNESFQIEGVEVTSWQILSLSGTIIAEGFQNHVDASAIETGVYMIKINNGQILKVIKQ